LGNDAEQRNFNAEIAPYFQSLTLPTKPLVIIDTGAACGLYSLATCLFFF
jgi:hypothetical protein